MALNISEPTEEQLQQLETIRINHDEAYLYVSQGLSYQEQHQYTLARDMYEKGLEKIDKALNIRCDRPYCHGPKWDDARKLQQKMRKTTQTIKSQLRDIQNCVDAPSTSNGASNGTSSNTCYTPPEPFELPPSYDEACEHELIAASGYSSCSDIPGQNSIRRKSSDVVELFSIQENVMLFYVSSDGSVTTTSNQSSLHIYKFVDQDAAINYVPPAWLQIGSWSYPLIPGQSPVLESGYGAFLFPNVSGGQDSSVGVILPPTVDVTQRAQFLTVLNSLTAFRGEEKSISSVLYEDQSQIPKSESFSDTLSRGIVTGAEYLSIGIVKGASLSSDLIHKGASKMRQKINPEDQPVVVDPRVQEGLKIAREVSGVALKATGFLVRKLGDLTFALGRQIAPHIKEQGSRLLSTALNKDKKEANETMDGVLTVAAGGLQGFTTIYSGLEMAARTLAYSLSQETVNIVGHKYGTDVGEVVGNAVFSIGNLALTTHNVQSFGVKAIAKRTAKDAGKAVLKDYVEQEKEDEEEETGVKKKKMPPK